MQNFVVNKRGGAGNQQNAQNGQPIDPDRQARAANARVQMKRPKTAQQDDFQSGLPSRGVATTQNTSAAMQHAPQHRQSGPAQRHDRYDTDAESIDTTVNQSIIQVEDSQPRGPQHQRHGEVVDLGSGSGDEEDGTDDDEGVEDDNDFDFTEEEMQLLEAAGMLNSTREQARHYLQQIRADFPTVDGDSYPSTTDGGTIPWRGAPGPPSEGFDDVGIMSPSPTRPTTNGQRSIIPQPVQPRTFDQGRDHNMRTQSAMFQQSASIRDQQKHNPQIFLPEPDARELGANVHPASQPPSYSQANRQVAPAPQVNHNPRQNNHVTFNQPQHVAHQPSSPARAPVQPPKSVEAPAPIQRPGPARTKAVSVIQLPPVDEPLVQEFNTRVDGDYDQETLFEMTYTQLKNESFDKNPRAGDQPLTDEMLEKALVERLDFAQKNLGPDKQSDFFRSLSTTEWEDTGDWFLDQFSSIINRSKEARQKKRKLAQDFEEEVERRHKHVAKKQHQVEDAMSKMQAQGEGLVPRSPRRSKSPKPKKA
jgi:hypothetical protein